MNEWSSFFSAIVSASATLTGLIFVGVSISLNRVLSIPVMPTRALNALALLVGVLLASILCLIPFQKVFMLGIELFILGVAIWVLTFFLGKDSLKKIDEEYKKMGVLDFITTQLSVIFYPVSGIIILFTDLTGIYWLIPGIVISIIKAILDAWVLLIEIHR